jgi:hypothetical protein
MNFRRVVFKRARLLLKTGLTWSESLKQAWKRYREFRDKTIENTINRIKSFDTYYFMSDDMRVIKKYDAISKEIKEGVKMLTSKSLKEITKTIQNVDKIKYFGL